MSSDYLKPIGPWPRALERGVIHKTTPEEVSGWVLHEDAEVLVLNKDGELPCHPSKDGPWSSLAGAVREHFGEAAAHLVFRLDRETSGAVLFARNPVTAGKLQKAVQEKRYKKSYLAILCGVLAGPVTVEEPLGDDYDSPVAIKVKVVAKGEGQEARTHFTPLASGGGFTLVRVVTDTGRKHQIRAHALWLGYPLVGDKIYGPDPQLFLDFIHGGWTPKLESLLHMRRQALHCEQIDLGQAGLAKVFRAPLASDMADFVQKRMGLAPSEVLF